MIIHAPRAPGAVRRRVLSLAAALTGTVALTAAQLPAPPPAPAGAGDRLFPHLGNPGYDVLGYHLDLGYGGDNTRPLTGRTSLVARAEATLERFNLDFAGGRVRSVTVDGAPAAFATAGEDLVIDPAEPPAGGTTFRVTVEHTSPTEGAGTAWIRTSEGDGGLVTAAQPDAAHRVFPANDHPSDKALFSFRISAPQGVTAVANGVPAGRTPGPAPGQVTWSYRTLHPMAPELVQIALGDLDVVHRDTAAPVALRDVVPSADREALEPWLSRTPGHLRWLEERLGGYPFGNYGVLVADAVFPFALETQTLSLFPRFLFLAGQGRVADWQREEIMVHELAHQWFGNSVTPAEWSDLWLSESHATWYEWTWAAEHGGPALEERVRAAYEHSDRWRAEAGPVAAPHGPDGEEPPDIFHPVVYDGGAVVLYALRERIGAAAFERLQRQWVARHRDGTAGTADFIALAGQVSGQELDGFLTAWLYGERTPAMPGHPGWRPAPRGSGGGSGGGETA
ncbi:M1 family metallopeptidase [Streptomyces aidingensis]|uniref:Aminopeptidase N n=1 Tax=Streptomyces aidingensis TaxID=910347 RepID=A0A1I1U1B5_9ACTN|nr:M1 family metallopeptidase [Streptomyces aidingensis]SFD64504.1 Peptidase family M1 [Streptomyces aidingensis]